jgi:hypothetical protein
MAAFEVTLESYPHLMRATVAGLHEGSGETGLVQLEDPSSLVLVYRGHHVSHKAFLSP